MSKVREKIPEEIFNYQQLTDALSRYSNKREKITALLRSGEIIRVKKGLYVFADYLRRRELSMKLLANLIYGPSYVSLEYALADYGLIPERVEVITSVVFGRKKSFSTPLGTFTYMPVSASFQNTGVLRVSPDPATPGFAFLMASPEKALADKILHTRGVVLRNKKTMASFLLDDLRVTETSLSNLDCGIIKNLALIQSSEKLRVFSSLIHSMQIL